MEAREPEVEGWTLGSHPTLPKTTPILFISYNGISWKILIE
jgi:hypothetical protein